ncbi:hypothetical protein Prum_051720 [Phytohabitans rumicis]|uniref:Uncharacterized protein n=1 Tax=Phytohabitans rumicis TaxID=1076125 RepID=A0A6V8L7L0_9ACTN|nr:hypothetical protein Prum_051720 [Phytohabitans rumicis]
MIGGPGQGVALRVEPDVRRVDLDSLPYRDRVGHVGYIRRGIPPLLALLASVDQQGACWYEVPGPGPTPPSIKDFCVDQGHTVVDQRSNHDRMPLIDGVGWVRRGGQAGWGGTTGQATSGVGGWRPGRSPLGFRR